jgi:hypothetical protein
MGLDNPKDCPMTHRLALFLIATTVASTLTPSARAEDWLIRGTFTMDSTGCANSSLNDVVGNVNGWQILLPDTTTVLLDGVAGKELLVGSTSWEFEFTGTDATLLNADAGDLFTQGGHDTTGFLSISEEAAHTGAHFYIWPTYTDNGVYFEVSCPGYIAPLDGDGFPLLEAFVEEPCAATLHDNRGDLCNVYVDGTQSHTSLSTEIVISGDDDDAADDDDDTTSGDDDDTTSGDDDDTTSGDDDTSGIGDDDSEAVGPFEGDDPGECDDGADNDRDGLFDCDDPECEGAPDCQGGCNCALADHRAHATAAGSVLLGLGLGLMGALRRRR